MVVVQNVEISTSSNQLPNGRSGLICVRLSAELTLTTRARFLLMLRTVRICYDDIASTKVKSTSTKNICRQIGGAWEWGGVEGYKRNKVQSRRNQLRDRAVKSGVKFLELLAGSSSTRDATSRHRNNFLNCSSTVGTPVNKKYKDDP